MAEVWCLHTEEHNLLLESAPGLFLGSKTTREPPDSVLLLKLKRTVLEMSTRLLRRNSLDLMQDLEKAVLRFAMECAHTCDCSLSTFPLVLKEPSLSLRLTVQNEELLAASKLKLH